MKKRTLKYRNSYNSDNDFENDQHTKNANSKITTLYLKITLMKPYIILISLNTNKFKISIIINDDESPLVLFS